MTNISPKSQPPLTADTDAMREALLAWKPVYDDRVRPLLFAEASRREAGDWTLEDAENVIAFLLSANPSSQRSGEARDTDAILDRVAAMRDVVSKAWMAADDSSDAFEADTHVAVPNDSFEALSDALDALEALTPPDCGMVGIGAVPELVERDIRTILAYLSPTHTVSDMGVDGLTPQEVCEQRTAGMRPPFRAFESTIEPGRWYVGNDRVAYFATEIGASGQRQAELVVQLLTAALTAPKPEDTQLQLSTFVRGGEALFGDEPGETDAQGLREPLTIPSNMKPWDHESPGYPHPPADYDGGKVLTACGELEDGDTLLQDLEDTGGNQWHHRKPGGVGCDIVAYTPARTALNQESR